jgi:hypothetical protein
MKLLTALLIALPIVSFAGEPAKLRYNWVEKKWNYAPKEATLKLNWVENQYEFVLSDSKLKLNSQSNNYEYVQSQINPYQSQIGDE